MAENRGEGGRTLCPLFKSTPAYTNLVAEETVALLLHVVVDDTRHLLLPDLEAVDRDVVLDVLKGPPETVHLRADLHQLGHQLTCLGVRDLCISMLEYNLGEFCRGTEAI